jgi:hypothetical protein
MGPSTLSTRAPYLGSEIHGPGTQGDSGRIFACFSGILRVQASMEPSYKWPSGPSDDGT